MGAAVNAFFILMFVYVGYNVLLPWTLICCAIVAWLFLWALEAIADQNSKDEARHFQEELRAKDLKRHRRAALDEMADAYILSRANNGGDGGCIP